MDHLEAHSPVSQKLQMKFINAKTPDDIRSILPHLINQHGIILYNKYYYNKHIGWALPTTEVCAQVVGLWRKYPTTRIVDMGAGSGLFCMMFHDAGIPVDKLLAIDKEIPIAGWQTTNTFWDILRDDDFKVPIGDIFFVAWGGLKGGLDKRLDSYIKRGGWCVVILGELDGGCTLPSDYFVDNEEWDSTLVHVDGPTSHDEYLSINIRSATVSRHYSPFVVFFGEKQLCFFFNSAKRQHIARNCSVGNTLSSVNDAKPTSRRAHDDSLKFVSKARRSCDRDSGQFYLAKL